MAKTVPNLPSNVYLSPINFGLSQGSNGSSQFGVGTMRVSVNNTRQLNQDFTKISGTHAFKFGYELLWQNYIQHDISNPRLSLTFGGTAGLQGNGSNIPNTGGITLADIMLGTSPATATPSRDSPTFRWTPTTASISRTTGGSVPTSP
jgi:hypothetical protein